MLPATRHRCNLDVWVLAQNRGDGLHLLVTPERVLSKYNKDLIFLHWFAFKTGMWSCGSRSRKGLNFCGSGSIFSFERSESKNILLLPYPRFRVQKNII